MIRLADVAGWIVYEDEDGRLYVRLEQVAAKIAKATPSVTLELLDFLLENEDGP